MFLFIITSILWIRNRRHGLEGYLKLESMDEKQEFFEQYTWKLVYADVFRTPPYPMCLSVVCGTGIQIFLGILSSLIYLCFVSGNQTKNGSTLMIILFFCMIMGIASGYVSANLYKTFKGTELKKNALLTALGLPAALFATFTLIQGHAISIGSSLAVSIDTQLLLLLICLTVEVPLVLIGYYFGQKHRGIKFPVNIRSLPNPSLDQSSYSCFKVSGCLCGLLPFSMIYIFMYFIMLQVWSEMNVMMMNNILVPFILFTIGSGLTSIISSFMMFQLQYYKWWWNAFSQGVSVAILVFLHAVGFSNKLHFPMILTYGFYFSCMGLLSLIIGVMVGAISIMSSLWFNLKLFDSLNHQPVSNE